MPLRPLVHGPAIIEQKDDAQSLLGRRVLAA